MNQKEQQELLRKKGVELNPDDPSDVTTVGLRLRYLQLRSLGVEQTGLLERSDIGPSRLNGYILRPAAYGVEVFEVMPAAQPESQPAS